MEAGDPASRMPGRLENDANARRENPIRRREVLFRGLWAMSHLQRVVYAARRRLWLRRWLYHLSVTMAAAAGLLAVLLLIQRSYALPIPAIALVGAMATLALLASLVWLSLTRESELDAAARLDEAAKLHERISSAWHVQTSADAFARATVADAERLSSALSPRVHLRLAPPQPLGWTLASAAASAATFLVPPGWMKPTSAQSAEAAEVIEARLAVRRELQELKKIAESTPSLKEFGRDLESLDKSAGGDVLRPVDVRHEALKKIDRLSDALRQKREAMHKDAAQELRRLLRRVAGPEDRQADTEKLSRALRQGDFKTANEELKALKEKLARLDVPEADREKAEQLRKQLEQLGRQIAQAAEAGQEEQKLQQQLNIDDQTMQRLVEQLKKGDLDQVRRDLEQRGLDPEQAKKLAEKLQQRQQAGELAKKLAQALQDAAKPGDMTSQSAAAESFTMAEAQLSELEMLDQQMAELDAALATLDGARQSLDDQPCSACSGTGKQAQGSCSTCRGSGKGDQPGRGGMGKRADAGAGGLAPEETTDVDFKKEKQKVASGQGAIIGQVLVDGEQVKGNVNPSWGEAATAAERDATDRIHRDRIPRQYHKAVRNYFSTMREATGGSPPSQPPPAPQGSDAPPP